MALTKDEWLRAVARPGFPRSAKYDPEWVFDHSMGPNVMWVTEALTEVMDLRPGMRVLDLGCGKAVSSIFLAKEFGVKVWAFDLWVAPHENVERIKEAGVLEEIFPIHGEAHALPFQEGFFDAILSVDAYHYWGTEQGYLGYLLKFLRPGGQVGILVPGTVREVRLDAMPERYQESTFKTADWWRRHWESEPQIEIERAESLPEGWRLWAEAAQLSHYLGELRGARPTDRWSGPLFTDAGATMGLIRVVARKEKPGSEAMRMKESRASGDEDFVRDLDGETREINYEVRPPVETEDVERLSNPQAELDPEWDWQAVLAHSLTWIGAFSGQDLIGFVNLAWDGGVHAFLLDPRVHPEFRRRGIGTELVRRAATVAREAGVEWLHVDFVPELRAFYGACGFRPTEAGLMRLHGDETRRER